MRPIICCHHMKQIFSRRRRLIYGQLCLQQRAAFFFCWGLQPTINTSSPPGGRKRRRHIHSGERRLIFCQRGGEQLLTWSYLHLQEQYLRLDAFLNHTCNFMKPIAPLQKVQRWGKVRKCAAGKIKCVAWLCTQWHYNLYLSFISPTSTCNNFWDKKVRVQLVVKYKCVLL